MLTRRMGRPARLVAVALALFQAWAPSVASLADSTVGARAAVVAHAEDHTQRSCVPAHPDDCALCRVLSQTAAPAACAAAPLAEYATTGVRVPRSLDASAPSGVRLQQSRAPPAS